MLQDHINACLGEQERGHGGVQLIFRISASRSAIAPSIERRMQPFPLSPAVLILLKMGTHIHTYSISGEMLVSHYLQVRSTTSLPPCRLKKKKQDSRV